MKNDLEFGKEVRNTFRSRCYDREDPKAVQKKQTQLDEFRKLLENICIILLLFDYERKKTRCVVQLYANNCNNRVL